MLLWEREECALIWLTLLRLVFWGTAWRRGLRRRRFGDHSKVLTHSALVF